MLDYMPSAPPAVERAQQMDTGISARQVKFAGYREFAIASPPNDGVVRNNTGSVTVQLGLDPGLQADHFVTVYLDGKAYRGRFGSSNVELTGVDPGEHRLRAKVIDAKGKTLIESEQVTFTLQRMLLKIQVKKVEADPDRPGKFTISGTFLGPRDSDVTLLFSDVGGTYGGKVGDYGAWTIDVGSEPAAEAIQNRLEVRVVTPASAEFKRVLDVKQVPISNANYRAADSPGYDATASPDYSPTGSSVSTTPGKTNPAFAPKYTP
jgi:hypothetical protein